MTIATTYSMYHYSNNHDSKVIECHCENEANYCIKIKIVSNVLQKSQNLPDIYLMSII